MVWIYHARVWTWVIGQTGIRKYMGCIYFLIPVCPIAYFYPGVHTGSRLGREVPYPNTRIRKIYGQPSMRISGLKL